MAFVDSQLFRCKKNMEINCLFDHSIEWIESSGWMDGFCILQNLQYSIFNKSFLLFFKELFCDVSIFVAACFSFFWFNSADFSLFFIKRHFPAHTHSFFSFLDYRHCASTRRTEGVEPRATRWRHNQLLGDKLEERGMNKKLFLYFKQLNFIWLILVSSKVGAIHCVDDLLLSSSSFSLLHEMRWERERSLHFNFHFFIEGVKCENDPHLRANRSQALSKLRTEKGDEK